MVIERRRRSRKTLFGRYRVRFAPPQTLESFGLRGFTALGYRDMFEFNKQFGYEVQFAQMETPNSWSPGDNSSY